MYVFPCEVTYAYGIRQTPYISSLFVTQCVVSPLVNLMNDQVGKLANIGISAAPGEMNM